MILLVILAVLVAGGWLGIYHRISTIGGQYDEFN